MEGMITKAVQKSAASVSAQNASQTVNTMLNAMLDREGFRKRFNDLQIGRAHV